VGAEKGGAGDPPPVRRRRRRLVLLGVLAVTVVGAGAAAAHEMRTSTLQARVLAGLASEISWTVEAGPSDRIRFPEAGPYDMRFGYTRIPEMVSRLQDRGFRVTDQAVISPRAAQLVDRGLFPIYLEKTAGGLLVEDVRGEPIFQARYPERLYDSLEDVPPVVVRSLLFIENRELLDPEHPTRNPVVEWDRLAGSVLEYGLRLLGSDRNVPGASTLATQIEKFRHSPDGITGSPSEKLRQLASGAVRAYLGGEETLPAQERIILDYLNTVPLAAIPGHGEVHGLAKGLWAWYGLDHEVIDRYLRAEGGPLRPGDVERPVDPPAAAGIRLPRRDGPQTSPARDTTEGSAGYGIPPVVGGAVQGAPGPGSGGAGHNGPGTVGLEAADPDLLVEAGRAYRATLSLLLAHRRPTWYLARADGRAELKELTDVYLRLMAREGMISPALREAALAAQLDLRPRAPDPEPTSFVERKAANTIRTSLLPFLGVPRLYDLDRYDLRVGASIDREVQAAVSQRILSMADPVWVREQGFAQGRLLARGDPAQVVYSFILYERTPQGNAVRVQTDNWDQPLDLNTAGRMELGSTAKLRTLVTYLDAIDERYRRFSGLSREETDALLSEVVDPITRWTVDLVQARPGITLEETLQAAMARRYSASPRERFVTGGGVHTFSNFDRVHDNQVITVQEAFRHSVNLPFIRMMRDIELYYLYRTPGTKAQILEDPSDPRRQEYLARFADEEGQVFINRFYRKLQGLPADSILDRVADGVQPTLTRLTWTFRNIRPEASLQEFQAFLIRNPPRQSAAPRQVEEAFQRSDPSAFGLADQGYLARIHPLEVWVARYLMENPEASRTEVIQESTAARQEVYRWLFTTRSRDAQDRRIRSLLEVEAFLEVAQEWQRLGYPFDDLTPSLASAIGSSGDRPASLAELVGILVNGGVRFPVIRVRELHFAEDTPFETRMQRENALGVRVLSREVAAVARAALQDVVESGTARRVRGAITLPDGSEAVMGGKTGTGDNRYTVTDARGRVVSSRALSRTSTFVFFFGDRFYGVMTAFVQGPEADRFDFTSALPAQLVRSLGPELSRLDGLAVMARQEEVQPDASGGGVLPGEEGVVTGGTGTGEGVEPPTPPGTPPPPGG
jgi:membrane peptidoglycan carboxypeptidase